MNVYFEFSEKVFINQIQKKPFFIKIEANEQERKALSKRFSIPAILFLSCSYQLVYFHGGHVRAKGRLEASVIQNCVVSLEDFATPIEEGFELLFIPAHQIGKELEALDDPDVIAYDHDFIDLGEATAQQLALLLDPYPHKPGVENEMVLQEETMKNQSGTVEPVKKESPFNILENLKKM